MTVPFGWAAALRALLSVAALGAAHANIFEHPNCPPDFFDVDFVTLNIPEGVGFGDPHDVSDQVADAGGKIKLPVAPADTLVTLSRTVNGPQGGPYAPVGRSFRGSEWLQVAGPDVVSFEPVTYDCCNTLTEGVLCKAKVPVRPDRIYHLTKYQREIKSRDVVARFLEQSTFGPTTSLLDGWDYSSGSDAFADFVAEQFAHTASSHRAYYRKRLNPRSTEVYKYGLPGPGPCEANARFRRFAFTDKDRHMSTHEDFFKLVISDLDSSPPKYGLYFAGSLRTVIDYTLRTYPAFNRTSRDWIDEQDLDMTGQTNYTLCHAEEMMGSVYEDLEPTLYQMPYTFGLIVNGICTGIHGGNPEVSLDLSLVDSSKLHILDLQTETVGTSRSDALMFLNTAKIGKSTLLLTTGVENGGCETFPDLNDNDYRGFDKNHPPYPELSDQENHHFYNMTCSKFRPDPPVFANITVDGVQKWAIHDPRVVLYENSITNPLLDGGASYVIKAQEGKQEEFNVEYLNDYRYGRDDNQLAFCANVEQNPFNEDHCVLSHEPIVCESMKDDEAIAVELDATTLQAMNEQSEGMVYAVNGLYFNGTAMSSIKLNKAKYPCNFNQRSRWLKVDMETCTSTPQVQCEISLDCVVEINNATAEDFARSIKFSADDNTLMHDIYFQGTCHPDDELKFGMAVIVTEEDETEQCYRNVHPDLLSVYELSGWQAAAKGGTYKTDVIIDPLFSTETNGTATFNIDGVNVDMTSWELDHQTENYLHYVGRLNDEADLAQFPSVIRDDQEVRNMLGQSSMQSVVDNRVGGTLVCGSQDEVAPDPEQEDYFSMMNRWFDSDPYPYQQKQTVWTKLALEAPDQLNQRVAWAFYQLFSVNVNAASDTRNSETNISWYDVLVRNALKNFRSLIKEVAFHPKMSIMLTYIGSSSTAFRWYWKGIFQTNDENFGREIMQLYTIGLVKLGLDGVPLLDQDTRKEIPTYDTVDVASLSRVWTGFWYGQRRGNCEELDWAGVSYMDPLKIGLREHDIYPKRGLDGAYLGDKYPLCVDLPPRAFLRKGARYRLLGGTSTPKMQEDPAGWDGDDSLKRMVLSTKSALRGDLCQELNGVCTYPTTLNLEANLPCDGTECEVDTVRVVQVSPGVFYEYIRVPCIQLAVYSDARKVVAGNQDLDMCAHPKMPVASGGCCGVSWSNMNSWTESYPVHPCEYTGERFTFGTYEERCPTLTRVLSNNETVYGDTCDSGLWTSQPWVYEENLGFDSLRENIKCSKPTWGLSRNFQKDNNFMWTNQTCSFKLLVNSIGSVSVIHEAVKHARKPSDPAPWVSEENTVDFFSVHWAKNPLGDPQIPSYKDNNCTGCYDYDGQFGEKQCLCDVTAIDEEVFTGTEFPTREEALEKLYIGHPDIAMFDDDDFTLIQSVGTGADEVTAYRPSNATDYGMDTVFKVTAKNNKSIFLKNVRSELKVGDGGVRNIRNIPNLNDIVDPELRDAYYEVDAALDHLLYHDNTAPFICKHLIQRFGHSNPSPRYVEVCSRAFQAGKYIWVRDGGDPETFGDGEWGNLQATIAAVLLHDEVLDPLLDADPASGALREPLLKVMGVLRAMDYTETRQNRLMFPILNQNTHNLIGQMAYKLPDQFSFFDADYTPTGEFSEVSLVAPESQVFTFKNVGGIINGHISLFRNGMQSCNGGFGDTPFLMSNSRGSYNACWIVGESRKDPAQLPVGTREKSVGYLDFAVGSLGTDDLIDELKTRLTSGRLSDANRLIVKDAYESFIGTYGGDDDRALRLAQQLITTTPEFHSTGLVQKNNETREVEPPKPYNDQVPYKAIVYLFLFGGMDSLYMLAPYHDDLKQTCQVLNEEYTTQRTTTAELPASKQLEIDASSSDGEQPCNSFGLHQSLSFFKDIYDKGDGIFLANTGALAKPVTRYNYFSETKMQLFSHKSMHREALYVDALREKPATGVLGRMLDVLEDKGYSVGPVGIDSPNFALDGDPKTMRMVDVISTGGPQTFVPGDTGTLSRPEMLGNVLKLNDGVVANSGLYGDYWSQNLVNIANKTDMIKNAMNDVRPSLTQSWGGGGLDGQLKTVAQLIMSHAARGVNRDTFTVTKGGFDSHGNMIAIHDGLFPQVNSAITKFYREMEDQNLINNVTVLVASEFGRTVTPNTAAGTDHAWGGNYFIFGGDIAGGKVMGQYPASFTTDDVNNDGRGRLIPTTPWDAVWNGVAQWFGVTGEDELNAVLPNRNNFGCRLFSDKDLYENGSNDIPGCTNSTVLAYEITLLLSQARYLTVDEQKKLCEVFLAYADREMEGNNTIGRCVNNGVKVVFDTDVGGRRLNDGVKLILNLEIYYDGDPETIATKVTAGVNSNIQALQDDITTSSVTFPPIESVDPIVQVTSSPSQFPSVAPSISNMPSDGPTIDSEESEVPSMMPSYMPSKIPSPMPSDTPSDEPSVVRSGAPSMVPSMMPSSPPSDEPSVVPSDKPSDLETAKPSSGPSAIPSAKPSGEGSHEPSASPQSIVSRVIEAEAFTREWMPRNQKQCPEPRKKSAFWCLDPVVKLEIKILNMKRLPRRALRKMFEEEAAVGHGTTDANGKASIRLSSDCGASCTAVACNDEDCTAGKVHPNNDDVKLIFQTKNGKRYGVNRVFKRKRSGGRSNIRMLAEVSESEELSSQDLEISYPIHLDWNGSTDEQYPMTFMSNNTWAVDICAHVPEHYQVSSVQDENGEYISSSECVFFEVNEELKSLSFNVVEEGGTRHLRKAKETSRNTKGMRHLMDSIPDPDAQFDISVECDGEVEEAHFDVPGYRFDHQE